MIMLLPRRLTSHCPAKHRTGIRAAQTCTAFVSAFVAMMLCGCVAGALPVPHFGETHGEPIKTARRKLIRVGKTSRADVVAQLGTNYFDYRQQNAIAYSWETKGLGLTWTGFEVNMYPERDQLGHYEEHW